MVTLFKLRALTISDCSLAGGGLQVVATRMPVSGTGQQRPIFQPPKIPQQQPVKDASAVKEAVNRAAPSAKVTADTSNKENADTGCAFRASLIFIHIPC